MPDGEHNRRALAWFRDGGVLTPELVADIVRDIADADGDAELQHVLQDKLVRGLVEQIASGAIPADQAADLARRTLEVYKLVFPRWYA